MAMKIFLSILIYFCISLNYAVSQHVKYVELKPLDIKNLTEFEYDNEKLKLDEDLQKDYDEILLVKNRTRLAACMLILRSSLSRGNKNVSAALKDSKHERGKTYDKIIANMLDTCFTKIEDNTADSILSSEDANIWKASYEDYLRFDKSVFQIIGPEPKLTSSEKFIVNEIDIVMKKPGIEIEIEEESSDFLTEKLGKYKYMAYGSTVGFTISFVFIVIYNLFFKK